MEDTFNEATLQQSKQIDESSLKELTGTFKEKWLTLLKTIKKNYKLIKDQQQTLDSNLKNFKSHLDLACLNTKDDTYMITSDGKYLVFLTFDYIIKYDIQNQEIVTKHTLAPLLFPFLKKMLVRRRDLLLNHDGNKILGIIEEKIGIESNYCFMIYNIQENTTKILDLKLENGEKVKEWIVADNWVNEIFYKVEKETKLRQIPPYETKKRKIEIIKKYDLRRGKSETFYVCHSVNGMFHKLNDDEDLVKHDVDIKHVPFFQLGWILIYEGVTRDPSIFNMKILDIHNKKILAPIIDKNFTKEFLASTSKMNFGYLHFIGNLGMEKLFLRSDFNIYALEPRLRLLHTINNLNVDLKKKESKIISNLLENKEVSKIRKLDIRFLSKENWVSLEMSNLQNNTGLVDIYHYKENTKIKERKLRICYNNNDRKYREIRIYHMTDGNILKLSDTPGCSNGGYFTAMNVLNLETNEADKYCTRIDKDTEIYSGIISVKVDWVSQHHVLMSKPKTGSNYKFNVVYHKKRLVKEFEIDLQGHRVESDTEFYLKGDLFLIWISKFGVFSYDIKKGEINSYKNELNLGKIYGVKRTSKKLPCFFKDGIRMVRDGITPPGEERTKYLNFYNFKTGELDTVFENLPNVVYKWNNYDFLYYFQSQNNPTLINIYDMETRNGHEIRIKTLEEKDTMLLRVDRSKDNQEIKDEYLISVYLKREKIIKNYKILENKVTKTWCYDDWIPNIKRVKFFGEKAYVMLSTVSSYILDDRTIIKANKRKMFEEILYRDWENLEPGIDYVEDVYYSLISLTEPFAYVLVEFFKARELFKDVCGLEIKDRGSLDNQFFGDFDEV